MEASLSEMSQHEKICDSGKFECSHQGCLERVMVGEMLMHKNICTHRPVKCCICRESFSPYTWTRGHPDCFGAPDRVRFEEYADVQEWYLDRRMVLLGDGEIIVDVESDEGDFSSDEALKIQVFGVLGLDEEIIETHRVKITVGEGLVTATLPIKSWIERGDRYSFSIPGELAGLKIGIVLD